MLDFPRKFVDFFNNRVGFIVGLTLMMSFPALFVGGDSMTLSAKNFIAAVLQSYIFALILSIFDSWFKSSKIYRISVFVFVAVFSSIDVWCCFVLRTRPLSYLVDLVFETNIDEAKEFCSLYLFTTTTAIVIICTTLVAISAYNLSKWELKLKRVSSKCLCAILVCSILVGLLSFVVVSKKENGHFGARNSMQILWQAFTSRNDYSQNIRHVEAALDDICIDSCCFDSPIIVLVIGESHSRLHSSIYSYNIETMPLMAKEIDRGQLIRFDSVCSPAANTGIVMRQMFSVSPLSDKERWYDYPLFPAVFKKAGYNVYYFDNQSSRYSRRDAYDLSSTYFLSTDKINDSCFDFRNDRIFEFDDDMIDFSSNISLSSPCLVVYHLMGQHMIASKRYKPEFDHFKSDDYSNRTNLSESQRKEIAAYDNATLFLDSNLKKIIDLYRDKDAIIVYVSDHGEEVHDKRIQYGRVYDSPKECVLEVPAFVWCSEMYLENRPYIADSIAEYSKMPMKNVDMSRYLLKLADIKMCQYEGSITPS